MMNLVNLTEIHRVDFTKYLLEKGADPNIVDTSRNSPLHQLAGYRVGMNQNYNYNYNYNYNNNQNQEKTTTTNVLNLIDLLISHGALTNTVNNSGDNPFALALRNNNIDILNKLVTGVKISQFRHLLH